MFQDSYCLLMYVLVYETFSRYCGDVSFIVPFAYPITQLLFRDIECME